MRVFRAVVVNDAFDAGAQVEAFYPDCIVVDMAHGTNALQIFNSLGDAQKPRLQDIYSIALASGKESLDSPVGANEEFDRPFDWTLLAERICSAVGKKKELVPVI